MGSLQPLKLFLQERNGQGAAELSQAPQVWPELDWVVSVSKAFTVQHSRLSEYWSLTSSMELLRNFPLLS